MNEVIVIKYGEIALKGNNRQKYVNKLINNICHSTSISKKQITSKFGRIYIKFNKTIDDYHRQQLIKQLTCIFGLEGFAFAYEFTKDCSIDELTNIAINIFNEQLSPQDKTFQVASKRINKQYPLSSMQLDRELGSRIWQQFQHLRVNLSSPDLRLTIELRDEGIYLYINKSNYKCSGGLPVGTGGNGLVLLSGGIDSPVAAWMMLKRGMNLDAVHFHSPPFTGEKSKEKVIDLCKRLSEWKPAPIKLFIPHFTNIQVEVNKRCPQELWTIIHRRFMLRIAEKIANQNHGDVNYQALITGDSLSQVASQTIENIAAIQPATNLPLLRPLIGLNKLEITKIGNDIGTFEISKLPYSDCCTVFSPKNPMTKAREFFVVKAEEELPIDDLIAESLQKMQIL